MVNAGFRAVDSVFWNSALSSKPVIHRPRLGFWVSPLARQHSPAHPRRQRRHLRQRRVQRHVFDILAEVLRVPNTDIRMFGKSESFFKRRMSVVLAFNTNQLPD